jgi:hypothetical protein
MGYDRLGGTDTYRLSADDVMGVQRRYGRRWSGAMPGYGGNCPKLNAEGERITAAECGTASYTRWSFTSVGNSSLEGVKTKSANGLNWERTSNQASASIRGQDPEVNALQRFPPINMQWLAIGNMCVTVNDDASGQRLFLAKCGEETYERWDFFHPSAGMIRLSGTNLCVRTTSSQPETGHELYLTTCNTASSTQQFTFHDSRIVFGSLCANVFGGWPDAGAQVGLWNGCSSYPQNALFHMSGRLKNGSECVRWADGPSQDIGKDLLVGACTAVPVPDSDGYARPDPMSWDYYW